jgi:hypothetical protein
LRLQEQDWTNAGFIPRPAKKFESRQDLAAPRLFTASLNFKNLERFADQDLV